MDSLLNMDWLYVKLKDDLGEALHQTKYCQGCISTFQQEIEHEYSQNVKILKGNGDNINFIWINSFF